MDFTSSRELDYGPADIKFLRFLSVSEDINTTMLRSISIRQYACSVMQIWELKDWSSLQVSISAKQKTRHCNSTITYENWFSFKMFLRIYIATNVTFTCSVPVLYMCTSSGQLEHNLWCFSEFTRKFQSLQLRTQTL